MRRILYIGILLIMSMAAWAQQGTTVATGLPYECSFEESEDLRCWNIHLSNTTDQWIFGSAVHSEGRRSMYISKDGTDPNYGKNPNVSVAMLRYKFPTASNTQKYDVSFDWKGVGTPNWVGLANYVRLFTKDPYFKDSISRLKCSISQTY